MAILPVVGVAVDQPTTMETMAPPTTQVPTHNTTHEAEQRYYVGHIIITTVHNSILLSIIHLTEPYAI